MGYPQLSVYNLHLKMCVRKVITHGSYSKNDVKKIPTFDTVSWDTHIEYYRTIFSKTTIFT